MPNLRASNTRSEASSAPGSTLPLEHRVRCPLAPAAVSTAARRSNRGRDGAREIPDATIARLPVYHRVLGQLAESDVTTVSSEELAQACGVSSAKLRKDLSHLGSYGTRGVGYDVRFLAYQISRELGLTQPWGVVIVGAGNLGHALVAYRGFASRGFAVVGLLDSHPDVVGQRLGSAGASSSSGRWAISRPSWPRAARTSASSRRRPRPRRTCATASWPRASAASSTSPRSCCSVPEDVEVRKVDLAVELQILAFHEQRRSDEALKVAAQQTPSFVPESLGEAINA